MKIGYARVSTDDCSEWRNNTLLSPIERYLQQQEKILKQVGCTDIVAEITLETNTQCRRFLKALTYLGKEDTLVVSQLDRLGCSILQVIKHINALQKRCITLRSVQENIDTNTIAGKLILCLLEVLVDIGANCLEKKIDFFPILETLERNTTVDKLVFHVLSALVEIISDLKNGDLMRDEWNVFRKSKNVKRKGRPSLLSDAEAKIMLDLFDEKKMRPAELAKLYNMNRENIYYYLKKREKAATL